MPLTTFQQGALLLHPAVCIHNAAGSDVPSGIQRYR